MEMVYHYLTNGYKHTVFFCTDELGNTTQDTVEDYDILCRCRASNDVYIKNDKGKKELKYKAGGVVIGVDGTCEKDGKVVQCNCGNEHTRGGYTFNKGIKNGSGTDLYLSCATT